ncbi:hypothetical protein ACIPLR_23180 [Herbaspirillum huttiense]|nr:MULTISPECIES: hypothetical protein [Herbaspirillum]MBP1313703.1 hypothetical protein [Herbaspirillum sp. 1130]MDR6738919.1 hypothetical protein [Herbaspirillum sp. 1173]MDT0355028.1 hypothetical protein [Herbaspirillum huttiense F1]MEE1635419.1 hypothetical protein [Herbaspirillum huttiense NC40101]
MAILLAGRRSGMVLPISGGTKMSAQKNAHSDNTLQYNGAL